MSGINDLKLEDHPLFEGMNPAMAVELSALADRRTIRADQTIFHEGSSVDGLYILINGMLSIYRVSLDGQQQLIGILGPGELAGEMALFSDNRRSASATAVVDCELAYIDRNRFFQFADQYPPLYRSLIEVLVRRLNQTNRAFAQNQFLPVSGQVAAVLVKLAENIGHMDGAEISINYRITHREIASMIGAARENVSRVLNQLKRDGHISTTDGKFVIQDLPRLKKIAEI